MHRLSWIWVASLACALTATGCGLLLDTQPPDAPVDAGSRPDEGVPECTRDADCKDDDVCNGEETCAAGRCVAGTMLGCADTVECTVDRCDPIRGCVNTPSDELCSTGETCFPDGCASERFCERAADCGPRDACLGVFECRDNRCQLQEPITCPDFGCMKGQCLGGACAYVPDSTECPGQGNCFASTCQLDGSCSRRIENDDFCDDDIDCTDDLCMTLSGTGFCSNIPNNEHCEDGVECTRNVCLPRDPTADTMTGCAVRFLDSLCDLPGGSGDCATPVCTPDGCTGVQVLGCQIGEVCDVVSGECEVPDDCDECNQLANPCSPAMCDNASGVCSVAVRDACPATTAGMLGYCDTSGVEAGLEPRCAERPNTVELPDIEPPITAAGLP